MKAVVDLNSDLGEGFGAYTMGMDREVLKYVTSANIACGYHAGDQITMARTVKLAMENGVMIGAHPGYPDLVGFGRREMDVTREEAKAYMIYQLGALEALTRSAGGKLQHMKLHGAFYNRASRDEKMAEGIVEGLLEYNKDIILLALGGSLLARLGEEKGLKVAHEVFADRAYNRDGTLVNRKFEGAMIHDQREALARVKRMVIEKKVQSIEGEDIEIKADSICVHGDNPQAVQFVKDIREGLENDGIRVAPLGTFI